MERALRGVRHDIVPVNDVPESASWVEHVVAEVARAGTAISPATTRVLTANRSVDALFVRAGFEVSSQNVLGPTPQELIARIAEGKEWQLDAAPEMTAVYEAPRRRRQAPRDLRPAPRQRRRRARPRP